jgi:hypothetical protein
MGGLIPAGKTAEDLAVAAAREMVGYWRQPENQAYMIGCVLAAGMAPKFRPLPGVLFVLCGGLVMRQAYLTGQDIASIAKAAKGGPDPAAA